MQTDYFRQGEKGNTPKHIVAVAMEAVIIPACHLNEVWSIMWRVLALPSPSPRQERQGKRMGENYQKATESIHHFEQRVALQQGMLQNKEQVREGGSE